VRTEAAKLEAAARMGAVAKVDAAAKVAAAAKLEAAARMKAAAKLDAPAKLEAVAKLEAAARMEAAAKMEAAARMDASASVDASTKVEVVAKVDVPAKVDVAAKVEAAAKVAAAITQGQNHVVPPTNNDNASDTSAHVERNTISDDQEGETAKEEIKSIQPMNQEDIAIQFADGGQQIPLREALNESSSQSSQSTDYPGHRTREFQSEQANNPSRSGDGQGSQPAGKEIVIDDDLIMIEPDHVLMPPPRNQPKRAARDNKSQAPIPEFGMQLRSRKRENSSTSSRETKVRKTKSTGSVPKAKTRAGKK